MTDLDTKLRAAERIGAILKARREHQDMSQRDVAHILGYRNINFISMIESGRSNPPLARLADIARAYGMDADFVPVMLREIYPETWEIIKSLLIQYKEVLLDKGPAALEKQMDKSLTKYMKDFGIS